MKILFTICYGGMILFAVIAVVLSIFMLFVGLGFVNYAAPALGLSALCALGVAVMDGV